MILIPVLILQIFLFPLTVGYIMNQWVDSRQSLQLQETAGHLGSAIQQIYFSLNHTTIQAGTLNNTLDIPLTIEGYSYTGTAAWRNNLDAETNSTKILDVTLRLSSSKISANASVILGTNAEWEQSTLRSAVIGSALVAEKSPNGTIQISFGTSGT